MNFIDIWCSNNRIMLNVQRQSKPLLDTVHLPVHSLGHSFGSSSNFHRDLPKSISVLPDSRRKDDISVHGLLQEEQVLDAANKFFLIHATFYTSSVYREGSLDTYITHMVTESEEARADGHPESNFLVRIRPLLDLQPFGDDGELVLDLSWKDLFFFKVFPFSTIAYGCLGRIRIQIALTIS